MRSNFLSSGRSAAMGRATMVASSHPLASLAAQQAYGRGGNAMDAALTAVIVQGVVEPAMTGIGGDCFALVARDGSAVAAYNGSGRSPAAASLANLHNKPIGLTDAAALTIPGAVAAWHDLHERYGQLPWADLFTAAISYAKAGFTVFERVAQDWADFRDQLEASPSARAVYLRPDGSAPGPGDLWHLPELATTLATLADEGAGAFYKGPLADQMLRLCQDLGGTQAAVDFAIHRGEWVAPISVRYAGLDVYQCPPNGQGLVALLAFGILQQAKDQGLLNSTAPFDPDRVEWQLRALSAGYELRDRSIADPQASQGLVEAALDPAQLAKITREITEQRAAHLPLYQAAYSPPHSDTVYVAARDASGLSVSLINSLFHAFGSTHVAGSTGILLHARGLSFSSDPAHPNAYGPAKRPLHTIMPALALDGDRVDTVFGVMGADYQPQGQVHVFTAMKDCGLSPQAAQDLPRWFANPQGFLEIETTVPAELAAALEVRFGDVRRTNSPLGGSQVIAIKDRGVMIAGTDPRKDGVALGS